MWKARPCGSGLPGGFRKSHASSSETLLPSTCNGLQSLTLISSHPHFWKWGTEVEPYGSFGSSHLRLQLNIKWRSGGTSVVWIHSGDALAPATCYRKRRDSSANIANLLLKAEGGTKTHG